MSSDVLIVGGGLHGLSAAVQIARRGKSVVLVERHFLGRHASGSTAAGVRTLGRDPAELSLSLEAARNWHHMQDIVGDDCGFKACGQLQVAENQAALSKIEQRIERLNAQGMTHEQLIGTNELRTLVPDLAPHCLGASWVEGDGSADPHKTIRAFRDAALKAGVQIIENCNVTALERRAGLWRAKTSKGEKHAEILVNAAGAWADQVSAMAGEPVHLAIRTSMMIVTERAEARIKPVVASLGQKLSFKQTAQGTLLIGGGSQGRLAPDRQSATVDMLALADSVKAAVRLFPVTKGLRIVRTWAGMEAMTSDHLPVLGFSRRAEGLVHAFGFSGHGFQLVPSVGRLIADLVCTGKTTHDLKPFDPDRVAAERVAA